MNTFIKIEKKSEHWNGLKTVVEACTTDTLREALTYVYKVGNKFQGADGYMASQYTWNDCQYPDGFYTIEKNTSKDILLLECDVKYDYPNLERLMPDLKDATKVATIENNPNIANLSILFYKLAKHDICMNFDLLKQVVKYNESEVYIINNSQPITFKTKNAITIVMPIKIKD